MGYVCPRHNLSGSLNIINFTPWTAPANVSEDTESVADSTGIIHYVYSMVFCLLNMPRSSHNRNQPSIVNYSANLFTDDVPTLISETSNEKKKRTRRDSDTLTLFAPSNFISVSSRNNFDMQFITLSLR